jgi:hypothetical protein
MQVSVTDEAPAGRARASGSGADAAQRARWLRFRVADTGIGVEPGAALVRATCLGVPLSHPACVPAPGNLERIFLPFVQAEQSTVRKYGGTVRRGAATPRVLVSSRSRASRWRNRAWA